MTNSQKGILPLDNELVSKKVCIQAARLLSDEAVVVSLRHTEGGRLMSPIEEQRVFDEYVELMRKLFETGELAEHEWQRRFALHALIVEIGSHRGEQRRLRNERLDAMIRIDAKMKGDSYLEENKPTDSVVFDGREFSQKTRFNGNQIGGSECADVAGAGHSGRCEDERYIRTGRKYGDSCTEEGDDQTDIINATAEEAADYYAKLFDW